MSIKGIAAGAGVAAGRLGRARRGAGSPAQENLIGAQVEVVGLRKAFGGSPAVVDVNFAVPPGSFLSILGPSGCGKTTTLRMIAGLERPDGGEIRIGGAVMSSASSREFVAPERRRVGFVHQSYALWPHMNVAQHLAYPLHRRGVPKGEVVGRVQRVLDLVQLADLHKRYPSELSGGQQQRVALARAIIQDPDVLLLDEPLSNLDASLRGQMGLELRALQRRLGSTAVYVTHDRLEALSLSDYMLVMNEGHEVEFARPNDIYERPRTRFGAEYVSGAVTLECRIVKLGPPICVILESGETLNVDRAPEDVHLHEGGLAVVAVRPEQVQVAKGSLVGVTVNSLAAVVEEVVYFGSHWDAIMSVGSVKLRARVTMPADGVPEVGSRVAAVLPQKSLALVASGVLKSARP